MAELCPYPIGRLLTRVFREHERSQQIFDLPARRFFRGAARDLSVRFHGEAAATPLGPAAGPHSQLAQNIVLSFLGGARVFELKTVQINDRLTIPRPCIDMQTVGYNVEWSQELTLEQSLEEYVKAAMLIEILRRSDLLHLAPGADAALFDMSVGYDLAGIQTERVRAFLAGLRDATPVIDRLRRQIPDEFRRFRDLDFPTQISHTLTLSTFHGCPPDEIERMIDWLLREEGLDCVIKLNPTLLGPTEARALFNERLGYREHIPDEAFAKDTTWAQAVDFCGRLGETAGALGRGFGVKFSNTLIVENHRSFFPATEKVMYLSGPPLHVLAMSLVLRFREELGDRFPISFSAGIDRHNFPDAVSLGLVPVTVCSDLLRTGGYGRMQSYFAELLGRMARVSATNVDEWVLRGQGQEAAARVRAGADGDVLSAARLLNTRAYVARLLEDPRYADAQNRKAPPKVGSRLVLFDCLTCDKCVPVCPNDANFTFTLPQGEIPVSKARRDEGGAWNITQGEPLRITRKHQIATLASFCNECGNCDVFCPEDGGPYVIKPRFFGTREEWQATPRLDGFHVERRPVDDDLIDRAEQRGAPSIYSAKRSGASFIDSAKRSGAPFIDEIVGRFEGRALSLVVQDDEARYSGEGFAVRCRLSAPETTLEGTAEGEVDLTYLRILDALRRAVLADSDVTFVNC